MGHLYHLAPPVSSKKLWDTVSFEKGGGGILKSISLKVVLGESVTVTARINLIFGNSIFGLVSNFDIRISDLTQKRSMSFSTGACCQIFVGSTGLE